jgi:hypothetical protein
MPTLHSLLLEPLSKEKGGMKMVKRKKGYVLTLMVLVSLMSVCLLMLSGCSSPPKKLDPSKSGPQVIVNPETIRLGVAKLAKKTDIVFEGAGFKPGDSIFITLFGPDETKAIVAEAPIQKDGTFKATVGALTKVMEILRGDITFNDKFENIIVISQPPIPEGVYTAKVTSMLSTMTAETKLNVKGPTVIDSLTDWLGKLTGKIQHKK